MYIIGIAGGTGSGKTTVVRHIISSLGIKDEDVIYTGNRFMVYR